MIKKFFFRRLKTYFSILMIPALILLIFIFIMLSWSKMDTINKASRNALSGIDENFELVTQNAFYQQDMMTLNPQLSVSLHKILLFSSTNYTDYIFLNSMQTLLSSASASLPYIHSIYFYLDNFDSFLSSEKGICNLKNYYDVSWHDIYLELDPNAENLVVPRVIPASSNSDSLEVLTIYQPMTYENGVIVANIPVDIFKDSMESLIPAWDNYLFILNSNQDILLSNSSQAKEESFASFFHTDFTPDKNAVLDFTVINNSLYLMNKLHNTEYDVHFILLTPASSIVENILSGILWPLAIVLAIFILVLLLSYITTKENFSHIEYVIQLFSDAEKGIMPETNPDNQVINNEYDLIMNNVIRLFLNTTFLQSQLAEQKYKKQAAELTTLQLQINPHFMINTLQTLNFEVYKLTQKPTGLNHIIDNLSDILRYSLSSENSIVSFSDEIEHIKKYVEIQKYRFPDSFLVYYEISNEVLELPFKRLILQPLVENSISHGIRATDHYGYIKIRIFIRQEKIYISVIDNGIGMTKARLQTLKESLLSENESSGIGLDNVNKRLILNYGQESALRIMSREGRGTCISFQIPLNKSSL